MNIESVRLKRRGIFMLVNFFAVLAIIFMPVFPNSQGEGVNGLNYLDNFFNQLSKGSAYYIDKQLDEVQIHAGHEYSTTLIMKSPQEAERISKLFAINDIAAGAKGVELSLKGDFAAVVTAALNDANLIYHNHGETVTARYGMHELTVLHNWYQLFNAMEKDLNQKKLFPQAKFLKQSMTKAIEPAYNYYKIQVKPVKEEIVLLVTALVFYVCYTIWYGFGLLYIFEGMGIKLEH